MTKNFEIRRFCDDKNMKNAEDRDLIDGLQKKFKQQLKEQNNTNDQ